MNFSRGVWQSQVDVFTVNLRLLTAVTTRSCLVHIQWYRTKLRQRSKAEQGILILFQVCVYVPDLVYALALQFNW